MASIQKHRGGWRAQVRKGSERDSRTFHTKQEAARWALQREAELSGRAMPVKSWGDALAHYRLAVTPSHKGARWEEVRLERWETEPLAKRRLADATPDLPERIKRDIGLRG